MSTDETKTITQMVAERPDVDVTDTWQQYWDILTGVRDRLMDRFDVQTSTSGTTVTLAKLIPKRSSRFSAAAIAKIQSYGITVNGCFILGLDADTPEVFGEVLRFVREAGLYEVQVTFQTAFPGTPLYARLLREHAEARCQDGVFAVLDQRRARVAEDLLDGVLAGGAGAAEQLERFVDDLH